jgi:hypothetical protein
VAAPISLLAMQQATKVEVWPYRANTARSSVSEMGVGELRSCRDLSKDSDKILNDEV